MTAPVAATLLLALTCGAIAATAADRPPDPTPDLGAEMASAPRTLGDLADGARTGLHQAWDLAHQRLREQPACRQLFADLGGDGARALDRTIYTAAGPRHERRLCGGRVAAFTGVGHAVTRLCRSFQRLPASRRALVLLHEALHFAGMPEAPADPAALDSAAINDLVAERCGL